MRQPSMVALCGLATLLAACDRPIEDPTGPLASWSAATGAEAAATTASNYSFQLLPSLPEGRWATAVALNNTGTVVGVGDWNASADHGCSVFSAAIVWSSGVVHNLHAALVLYLGLTDDPTRFPCFNGGTMALDVNDAGDVLLISSLTSGDNSHYIWNARSGFRGVFSSRVGGPISLNNRGEVVGYIDGNFELPYAAYSGPSAGFLNIDPAEYGSIATDISDDGWIVGCVRGQIARWRLHQRATLLAETCLEGLGVLPGVQARPISAVARGGSAVFSASRAGVAVPLIWRNGEVSDAGWGVGSASGLSDLGRVVGWGYPVSPRDPRAVTRFRSAPFQWLPVPSAATTSRAYSVNQCGDVSGHALDVKGRQRAVVWRVKQCDQG